MIRNVIFDMGDVLMDYRPMNTCLRLADSPEDAQIICRALFQAPEWAQKLDRGLIAEEEMLALCLSRLATLAQKEAAARVFAEYHLDTLNPMPGMEPLLEATRKRGFRLYLLSNVGTRVHRFLHKVPGVNSFDGFLFSYQVKQIKPGPDIYRCFLEKFSLRARECLFVDDVQANVDGAVNLGLQGYCFEGGDVERLKEFLAKLPSHNAAL